MCAMRIQWWTTAYPYMVDVNTHAMISKQHRLKYFHIWFGVILRNCIRGL